MRGGVPHNRHSERAPVAGSQIFSVLSRLPLTSALPSEEKAQQNTQSECPLRVYFTAPARERTPQQLVNQSAR